MAKAWGWALEEQFPARPSPGDLGNFIMRKLRAFLYRRFPAFAGWAFRKKLAGFERRWNLETAGFTKEGFFGVLQERFSLHRNPGLLMELAVGDGLVGSLGLWLESSKSGWKVKAWEDHPEVLKKLRKNRPATEIHAGRLPSWQGDATEAEVTAVTTRGVREASWVCRAIREGRMRPAWLGIWNPRRHPVWYRRLLREGYRLELVWQNVEFYVDRRGESGIGGSEAGGRKRGVGRQGSGVGS